MVTEEEGQGNARMRVALALASACSCSCAYRDPSLGRLAQASDLLGCIPMSQTRPLQGGYSDLLCVELRASDGRHPDCHSVFVARPTDDGPLLTFFDLFFFSRTYVHIYCTTCHKYNTYYQMRSLDRI